jgi:hypothetical protein
MSPLKWAKVSDRAIQSGDLTISSAVVHDTTWYLLWNKLDIIGRFASWKDAQERAKLDPNK